MHQCSEWMNVASNGVRAIISGFSENFSFVVHKNGEGKGMEQWVVKAHIVQAFVD